MVPFDAVTSRDDTASNSGGGTIFCESFEMLGLPVMGAIVVLPTYKDHSPDN